jgi:hypothetical protein
MKIAEFIENFKSKKVMNTQIAPNAVGEYIKKELEVKSYIPFVEKQSIAQIVLESCASIKDGVVAIDSIQKYVIFTIMVLSTYTNLEFDGDEDLESYDALCSHQIGDGTLLDEIVKTFEKEYVRCNDILNMMTADLLAENNIEKQVGKFLSGISEKINNLGDSLINKLGDFNMDLNQLDIDKLSDVISKIK